MMNMHTHRSLFKAGRKRQLGFSLLELLVVLAIVATLAFFFVPNAMRNKSDAEESLMISKLNQLNLAKSSFGAAYGTAAAEDLWDTYGDDADKFNALKPYLAYPPASIEDFVVAGYDVSLGGDVSDRVEGSGPSGALDY